MRTYEFTLCDTRLTALPSGALWWSKEGLLCVSDLHFSKTKHPRLRSGALVPPNENRETLARLERDILKQNPTTIICLGDSFDDLAAFEEMDDEDHRWLTCLMAGRHWIWIEGSHDSGPVDIGGTHVAQHKMAPLAFRHIANANETGEISGHFHPKTCVTARGQSIMKPCFLIDDRRIILPAYGTLTDSLPAEPGILGTLMSHDSIAVLTGKNAQPVPMHL